MRILWFTNTPSCYCEMTGGYNGGGWISSLEKQLRNQTHTQLDETRKVEIGICFYYHNQTSPFKTIQNGVVYYPLRRPKKLLGYTLKAVFGKPEVASAQHEELAMPSLLNVVKDFQPDLIHVFGSENIYGLLAFYDVPPIVLHLQGILSPCLNAFLPPFVSWSMYFRSVKSARGMLRNISEKIAWKKNCITEQRMFKRIKYFMGRTEWDRNVTTVLNPKARYFYCSEMLRDTFYVDNPQRRLPSKHPIFVTIISSQLYKGMDMLLKTAKILKNMMNMKFEWNVYGDVVPTIAEEISGVSPKDVNVNLLGVASSEMLTDALLHSTAYIHTSYIDNSPNSLCEAMILGCTCISTNVGGISSLIEHGQTGFLVPANDPYSLSHWMAVVSENLSFNKTVGTNARKVALERHDKEKIAERVVEIYNQILKIER